MSSRDVLNGKTSGPSGLRGLAPDVSDFLFSQLHPGVEDAEVVLLLKSHLVHADVLLRLVRAWPT